MVESKAIEAALAVAIWEFDPEMDAPENALGRARSIISSLAAEGLAIVPVEPSDAMLKAGCEAIENAEQAHVPENDVKFWGEWWKNEAASCHRAMIAASQNGEG